MSDENWMSPKELRAVADYCDALAPLWHVLTSGPNAGITVEQLEPSDLTVYDGNGDTLGRIAWAEDGAAFYPGKGETSG